MDEMSVEKWWNEIGGRGKREKPREKPTQTPLRPPRNPHGVTETRTRDPSGGRRATNSLRHEAAKIIIIYYVILRKLHRARKIFLKIIGLLRLSKINLLM